MELVFDDILYHYRNDRSWKSAGVLQGKALAGRMQGTDKKYLYGLSFVNYNMLVTNWDADNMEEILTPCMFEASEKGMDRRHLFSGRTGVPILFQWALAALRTGTGLFFAV